MLKKTTQIAASGGRAPATSFAGFDMSAGARMTDASRKDVGLTGIARGFIPGIGQSGGQISRPDVPNCGSGPSEGEAAGVARPPTFFLIRHGESTGNIEARLQGARIGGTLSERGHRQSIAAASYLFDTFEELRCGRIHLVSSPANRAQQTASAIGGALRSEIHNEEGLAELDFGDWSGTAVTQLEADRTYQQWKADPWFTAPSGGESLFDVRSRICRTISQLITRATGDGHVLVAVTHFFPLLVLFDVMAAGQQVRCDNASISRFELQESGWRPTHINQVRHLVGAAPTLVQYV